MAVKYTLDVRMTVAERGLSEAVWRVWTDMERFADWDPREEETHLDGPFATGTTGRSKQRGGAMSAITISAVEPNRMWQVETPLPGGKLVIDHRVEDLGARGLRLSKRYVAHGPTSLAFRAYYARQIRKQLPASF